MKVANLCASLLLLALGTTGCSHKAASPPQQAQAPPLQTGKGTLPPPDTTQQQEKSETPLASPLPPPSAQSVPLPPPTPKKVRNKKPKPAPSKSTDTTQTAGATPANGATAQVSPQTVSASGASGSPIGQLTTGDSALGERTKHETADLIGGTQQGLNGIKRSLTTDEQVTASQIRTFLKQAQQELDTGDTDGAHTLATKAKLLLDELTKP
jgi:outer membrane biosynthesis protein TonB